MRLGIITFHSVINYGSALQAYAMQEGIAKLGVDTELIDYRPELRKVSLFERIRNNRKRLFDIDKWKRFLSSRKNARTLFYTDETKAKKRKESFAAFQNEYFRLSDEAILREDLRRLDSSYDAFVCGSDQIWNPTYIGHDMSYYLDFTSECKRIAYAPSIAVTEFPQEYLGEIKQEMEKFSNISVRENESLAVVEKLTGKKATVVVDPTLLLDQSDWEKIEKKPGGFEESTPYIFCYFLGASEEYIEYVDCMKQLTGLPIVLVTCTELKVFRNYGDIMCDDVGPGEFVYLVHHADYVCTDSFHGTVFSIIHEKNFFTFKRYKDKSKISENSRVYTLLKMTGYPERLVESVAEVKEQYRRKMDYKLIHERIMTCRYASEMYLRSEINRVRQ